MNNILPIGIEELLGGAVETARLEAKASWHPETTGHQVIKTLCAFANDLQNLNGGYVLIGVAEKGGVLVRPVQGVDIQTIDAAQKWIRGNCRRIEPSYMPVMYVVQVDARWILVLWAPASDSRPHQAPDEPKGEKKFWIRVGSESIVAQGALLTSLMQQTARVPFDDRRASNATNEDLSFAFVREFLSDVHSQLLQERDAERVFRAMQIVVQTNDHTVPKNIGLLHFSTEPHRWFRGAKIEFVEFLDDAGGNTLTEKIFTGPLHDQLRRSFSHLEGMTTRHLEKTSTSIETRGWVSFPVPALREALVNAVYHRSYENSVEPIKVYLYPRRVEIISYPGPVPGIDLKHLAGEASPPPVPARNRRIGEFLKELRLAEGRGTGLPKMRRSMAENGSPVPEFDFDADRSYFRVTLPAHPEYVALTLLREYAYKRATGEQRKAREILQEAWQAGLRSPSLLVALVRDGAEDGDLSMAEGIIDGLDPEDLGVHARAVTALAGAFADAGDEQRSTQLLDRLPPGMAVRDAFDAAILERRLGREDRAHQLFEQAGALVFENVRALHEFAQTKLKLTAPLRRSRRPVDQETRRRLLHDAVRYLGRVTQMDAPPTRHAWAWFHLGQAREWSRASRADIIDAYERASVLAPNEDRFCKALEEARRRE